MSGETLPFLAAVVPAAGRSSRMGRSKPLLELGSRSFLDRVLDTHRMAGLAVTVVVVSARDRQVAGVARQRSARVAVNPDPDSEMMDSIRLGLQALEPLPAGVFVHPCDVPLVGAAVLHELASALREPGTDAVVPARDGRGGHPVLLARPAAMRAVRAPAGATLRDVLHRSRRVIRLPVEDEGCFMDCDRPEDLPELERLLARSS